jgi:hypothetical protein
VKTLEISRDEFMEMLRACGWKVPPDADVVVRVPGGGDYSNMDLDIAEHPIIVRYSKTRG